MKNDPCPSCRGLERWHIVSLPDVRFQERPSFLSLAHSLQRYGSVERERAGRFEVVICADCGYLAWYVADPRELCAGGEALDVARVLCRDCGGQSALRVAPVCELSEQGNVPMRL